MTLRIVFWLLVESIAVIKFMKEILLAKNRWYSLCNDSMIIFMDKQQLDIVTGSSVLAMVGALMLPLAIMQ